MHVAPIQKNLYTVHTQVCKGSKSCHRSQLDHELTQRSWYVAFRWRGLGQKSAVLGTFGKWNVCPLQGQRPLPILDPFGERSRDKVCRKSTSVTTGRLPSWGSIGQTSHAPTRERERYSECCLQAWEVLQTPTLLGRLPQLCVLCRQVYSLHRLPGHLRLHLLTRLRHYVQ